MTPRLKSQLIETAVIGVLAVLAVVVLRRWGLGGPLVMLTLFAVLLLVGVARRHPPFRDWLWDRVSGTFKRWYWREEEGRHHVHRGVHLDIADDGRDMWIEGDSVLRVLGRREADDVLAARHSGRWKRGDDGTLWLRVDAVVERLAHMPGRMEPKVVHFRRYLEQVVLFPAAERRRRASP